MLQPGGEATTADSITLTRRRAWSGVFRALVVVVGVVGGTVGGWRWATSTDQRAQQSFDRQASEVAMGVTTALQRDVNLATASRATIAADARLTNPGLTTWFAASQPAAVQAHDALGVTFIQKVSAPDFYYFVLALAGDPIGNTTATTSYSVTPSGSTTPYCLTRLLALPAGDVTTRSDISPPGLDWCATSMSSVLNASTDSGGAVVSRILTAAERQRLGLPGGTTSPSNAAAGLDRAYQLASRATLMIVPVYQGATPNTLAGRRAASVGWVAVITDPARLVDQTATTGGLRVSVAHTGVGGTSDIVAGAAGSARPGSFSDAVGISVAGQWTVFVDGPRPTGLASGTVQGTIAGAAIAVIALVFLLALRTPKSRRRGADVADAENGELAAAKLSDPLTRMPSHALVTDRAEQMLARSRRSQVATAALVVGLDNMSDINTLYGWDTGDEVLRAVGQRLSGTLREADTVGRLGGDEFVVLAEGASLAAGPEVIAERLLDVLRGPIHLEGGNPSEVVMSASVGIALGPRLAGADLLRDAGIAMRQAKSQGAGRFALFELDTSQALESRIALEGELRRAVDNEEFTLRYQPIFDIDSRTTTGVEAFLRWERPDGRLLPPDHFISHLERAGLMDTVGRWVLRHACIQGAELRERGRPISMSVNVSLAQLESESLVSDVADALSTSGLDPHALVIEVAEMALLRNTALALQRLTALKALGVRIAVDDFGTGFSSLAYLRQFPIDILKIDRSFIDSVATSSESSTLIHTLVEFGQTLGLEVIAEGIENEGQLHPLILANCDAGQGFLYGRPLTPAQLDLFLSMHDTAGSSLWVVRPE